MYLYYEIHRDAHGAIALTEMRLSSYGDGRLAINFRNPREVILFDLCKTILKFPPLDQRSYDDTTKCWTYFSAYGEQVRAKLKEVTCIIEQITFIEVQDLAAQALNGRINFNTSRAKKMRDEDFFYNHGKISSTPTLSKETVAERLKTLIGGDTLDKSAYRKAALRFHPDRNQGDGTRMSELNMLWQIYNA